MANEDSEQIAIALAALINNDTTSPIAGLFIITPGRFDPGDANANGLNDDRGGFVKLPTRGHLLRQPPEIQGEREVIREFHLVSLSPAAPRALKL